jgi:hypothetical protein
MPALNTISAWSGPVLLQLEVDDLGGPPCRRIVLV